LNLAGVGVQTRWDIDCRHGATTVIDQIYDSDPRVVQGTIKTDTEEAIENPSGLEVDQAGLQSGQIRNGVAHFDDFERAPLQSSSSRPGIVPVMAFPGNDEYSVRRLRES
jgi:hypothetical protein